MLDGINQETITMQCIKCKRDVIVNSNYKIKEVTCINCHREEMNKLTPLN